MEDKVGDKFRNLLTIMGLNVQTYRFKQGYTQEQLSEMVGISRSSIANIEGGRQAPNIWTIAKISMALKTDIPSLFEGFNEEGNSSFRLSFEGLRFFNQLRDTEFKKRGKAKQWNLVDRSNELAGEAGELCNMTKKIRRVTLEMLPPETAPNDKEIEDEIADILITLDLIAMDLGIRLEEVTPRKFNESSDKFNLNVKMGS